MMNNQHLQQYMEQKICSKFLFALKQIASQTNKKPLVVSISKSEVSKYRTVNDCETRRRQPLALVFKALWAKWWRWQSDQICRWIYKSSIVDIVFAIIVSQAFLYHSSMCSYLTDSKILLWWTKILPYDRIFNKCLLTPPNVLNVSNYFNSMIYKIWYWQINILWYSKYKIRKFRENWINLVASCAKLRKDHLLFVKVEA